MHHLLSQKLWGGAQQSVLTSPGDPAAGSYSKSTARGARFQPEPRPGGGRPGSSLVPTSWPKWILVSPLHGPQCVHLYCGGRPAPFQLSFSCIDFFVSVKSPWFPQGKGQTQLAGGEELVPARVLLLLHSTSVTKMRSPPPALLGMGSGAGITAALRAAIPLYYPLGLCC